MCWLKPTTQYAYVTNLQLPHAHVSVPFKYW
jgi:hypothetical protein